MKYTYLFAGVCVCVSEFHLQACDNDAMIIIIITSELSIAVAVWSWLPSSRLGLEKGTCRNIVMKAASSAFTPKAVNEAS